MITTTNLSKSYNGATVLNVEHLEIPKGESFGLVGNNGAGKTTYFSLLLDLIRPTTGHIENNAIIVNESEDWKPFTSSFIDESFLIGYLTAEEYFYFIGDLRGQNKATVDAFLADFEDFFNGEILGQKKYLRDLSKGNQKKAGIIAALIGNPQVIILDEPFANLDPTTQIRLKRLMKELTENREVTLLVSSHDLLHVTEVCERIVVLEKGEVVKDLAKSPETLKELEEHFNR
ncbi:MULTISPECIES: ABC transporter ATP-binding protein [Croceibacter]|mgnify:CR=1 FL=1|jgi:ABC-2 type transport system ATP-binding protein|uniref:Putative ATP-binding component of ABC transporter protein n=1 Tax=Croceibacter atlanticus (strain ATCC BAA-628 / JCM 21780 / CIP 108009 / IAM 15332 / KCTC 12090 / HTCC2559) TaxID=216432 RepID=A3U625_CROAH|nr:MULTISPECIES: ABC transporter ATP-binding protein [Croceibacter]EAP87692.1 putative ATP-binding component of ABC transporter protein [Croceibacter atlanticus HTCC2559]MBG25218.1 ABC transporter ATP-binding protein [Croceibacter sp.]MBW4970075.1 ABC transporter ATP-binding protein [Croceibacter atlanticus]WSP35362.1 ABC transporter ATP-binding protein [Croceibacter atlanticus]|tara:strand:- start:1730 stop:2425 length:696 start_codon:yes stop_codon:yes gene_type:complete